MNNWMNVAPSQLVPEKDKTEDWYKANIDDIIAQCGSDKRDVHKQFRIYDGEYNGEDFSYITSTFGIDFPAQLKHIPLVRPLLEVLKGEEWARPLSFTVYTEDDDSIAEKFTARAKAMWEEEMKFMQEQVEQGTFNSNVVERKMEERQKYYNTSFQTDLEIATHKFAKSLIAKIDMKSILADQWEDQLVTGREYYRCKPVRVGQPPMYECIDQRNFWYSENSDVKWVRDCDWAMYKEHMSSIDILDRWGHKLSDDDIKFFTDGLHSGATQYSKIDYGYELGSQSDSPLNSAYSYDVYHTEWKTLRKLYVDDEHIGMDADLVRVLSEDDFLKLPKKKKQKIKVFYIQERCEGVRIGSDKYVDMGISEFQMRSLSDPSKVPLTFNGKTNSIKAGKPYSLVELTKDLQDLYNIMHFHKENMIALSGSKATVMDLSQMPSFGDGNEGGEDVANDMKMWMYYKKLGTMFIDRSKEGADKTFNQFQSLDESLGNGIQQILGIIQHLEQLAGRIIGVPPERTGDVNQYQGKGVTDSVLVQSSKNTEPLYKEHYEVVQQGLRDLVNAARFCYPEGTMAQYMVGDYLHGIFQLPDTWCLADYGVFISNMLSEERDLERIKALAETLVHQQMLDVGDLFSLFRKESLKEVQLDVEQSTARKAKENAEAAQQAAKSEQGAAQAETQFKQQELGLKQQELKDRREMEEAKRQDLKTFNDAKLRNDDKRIALEREQLTANMLNTGTNAGEVRNS